MENIVGKKPLQKLKRKRKSVAGKSSVFLFIAFGLKIKLSSMIEYCNQRFPGKSNTKCYEYIEISISPHMVNQAKW